MLEQHLLQDLLSQDAVGLGATLILATGKPAFSLGTMSQLQPSLPESSAELMYLFAENRPEFRESILRDFQLHLPLPSDQSTHENVHSSVEMGDGHDKSDWIISQLKNQRESGLKLCEKRAFKPLFYTNTSLYCTSMPVSAGDGLKPSPGDGLVVRPVTMGLLVVHVAANYSPTASLEAVERCVTHCNL
ncbi:unnamed protein product [Calicophoron daubneyi]